MSYRYCFYVKAEVNALSDQNRVITCSRQVSLLSVITPFYISPLSLWVL